ncbi:MAG: ankyrin repeat domain-containing protein [Candidatus Babeliales bacterium]
MIATKKLLTILFFMALATASYETISCQENYQIMLIEGAKTGNIPTVTHALEQGAKINQFDQHGNNALIYATSNGHGPMAILLLAHGAHANDAGNHGLTPLMHAAFKNSLASAEKLLEHGANPYATNNQGFTAFNIAETTKSKKILALLKKINKERNEALKIQQQLFAKYPELDELD